MGCHMDMGYHLVPLFIPFSLGLQKNRSLASLYDRTGVCTIRTLIKNDQNDLRTGTRAEFRPFVDALMQRHFSCTTCDYSFHVTFGLQDSRLEFSSEIHFYIVALKRHCRTHKMRRPFSCTTCNYSFHVTFCLQDSRLEFYSEIHFYNL